MSLLKLEVGVTYQVIMNPQALVGDESPGKSLPVPYSLVCRADVVWEARIIELQQTIVRGSTGLFTTKVVWSLMSKEYPLLVLRAVHYEPLGTERLFKLVLPSQTSVPESAKPHVSAEEVKQPKAGEVKTWRLTPGTDGVLLTTPGEHDVLTKRLTVFVPVSTVFSEDEDQPFLSCMGILVREGESVFIKRPSYVC